MLFINIRSFDIKTILLYFTSYYFNVCFLSVQAPTAIVILNPCGLRVLLILAILVALLSNSIALIIHENDDSKRVVQSHNQAYFARPTQL